MWAKSKCILSILIVLLYIHHLSIVSFASIGIADYGYPELRVNDGGVPISDTLFPQSASASTYCKDASSECIQIQSKASCLSTDAIALAMQAQPKILESLHPRFDVEIKIQTLPSITSNLHLEILRIILTEVAGYSVTVIDDLLFNGQLDQCLSYQFDLHNWVYRSNYDLPTWQKAFSVTDGPHCVNAGPNGFSGHQQWYVDIESIKSSNIAEKIARDYYAAYAGQDGVVDLPTFSWNETISNENIQPIHFDWSIFDWVKNSLRTSTTQGIYFRNSTSGDVYFIPPICQRSTTLCGLAYGLSFYFSMGYAQQQIVKLGWRIVLLFPPTLDGVESFVGPRLEAKLPVLFMANVPPIAKWASSNLVSHVLLPQADADCLSNINDPDSIYGIGSINCDFVPEPLTKIMFDTGDIQKQDALRIFSLMLVSPEPIKQLSRDYFNGTSFAKLACQWIQSNGFTWASWFSVQTPPPELYDGLVLSLSQDPGIAIVSYVLAVVGCFVASLLLEDPMFHAQQNKYSLADYMQTSASALTLSIASIWPSFCMCYLQLSIQSTYLLFDQVSILTAWIPVWFLFWIVLNIKMMSLRALRSSSDLQNSESHNKLVVVQSSQSQTQSSSPSLEIQVEEAEQEQDPESYTTNKFFLLNMFDTMKHIDRFSIVASICFTSALVIMETMGVSSLIVPATITLKSKGIISCIIICMLTTILALQLQFHMNKMQWINCLFMALPIFLAHQITMQSLIFTYSKTEQKIYDQYSSSSRLEMGSLVLISIVIAATCCFALIIVQFYRNKITSHGWLRQLVATRRSQLLLKRQLKESNQLVDKVTMALDDAHVVMLLINLYRPFSFDHTSSIVWSLSQQSASNAMTFHRINDNNSKNKSTDPDHIISSTLPGSSVHNNNNQTDEVVPISNFPVQDILSNNVQVFSDTGLQRVLKNTAPNAEEFNKVEKWIHSITSKEAMQTPLLNAPDLNTVLQHPFGIELFRAHLGDTKSEENLNFIVHLSLYEGSSDENLRIKIGKDIYHLFIHPRSPQEINVSADVRKLIKQQVESHKFNITLFERARKDVMNLMMVNSWNDFIRSPSYRLVTAVMNSKHLCLRS